MPYMGWAASAKAALETSYGTSKAGSAAWVWLDLVSEGIEEDRQAILSAALTGLQGARKAAPGVFMASGPLPMELGPENCSQILYAAFGSVSSAEWGSYTPDMYDHTFTLGKLSPSFEMIMDLVQDADADTHTILRHLSGITVQSFRFTGSMENFVMFEPTIRAQKSGPYEGDIGTVSPASQMPFVPIDGSITIGGSAFTDSDNWEIATTRNPAEVPRWGSQFLRGVAPGAAVTTLTWDLYFDTVAELARFFGDYDNALTTRLEPQDVLETANIVVTAKNTEASTNGDDYQVQFKLPKVVWQKSGSYIKGKDIIRQPMQGVALYDSSATYDFAVVLRNTQTNATITT